MVEAPARDRKYYLARRMGIGVGADDSSGADDHLKYEDSRIQEIAKGYAMQAVFYALTGEPFCVTCSIGLAKLNDHTTNPEALLNASDQALYDAKASGRNRLVLSLQEN